MNGNENEEKVCKVYKRIHGRDERAYRVLIV